MEELSKNLMIAVYVHASQQLRTAEYITHEAQAYHQQRANLPTVVQMTRKIEAIYVCACVRHGVREIGAIYGNSMA